jgi:excisionase family DNA binding protein
MSRTIAADGPVVAARDEDPSLGRLAYSVDEVTEVLGIGRTLAWTLVRSGQLPAIRVSGRVLVRRRQLIEWLEGLPNLTAPSSN